MPATKQTRKKKLGASDLTSVVGGVTRKKTTRKKATRKKTRKKATRKKTTTRKKVL